MLIKQNKLIKIYRMRFMTTRITAAMMIRMEYAGEGDTVIRSFQELCL